MKRKKEIYQSRSKTNTFRRKVLSIHGGICLSDENEDHDS